MAELLTAAQMRAIETAAMASGEVSGLELMERAGAGVVAAIMQEWPELEAAAQRALVLCGPGNNGGDGFVIARLLAERGWEVEVYLYGDPGRLPPDARTNYERWREIGTVQRYEDDGPEAFWLDPELCREQTVLIDALFGTGLTRPVEAFNAVGWATQISEWRLPRDQRRGAYPAVRVVAVDLPSGLCADSGRRLRSARPPQELEEIRADLTVTFHARKLGHVLAEGPALCGKVVVAPIGLETLRRPRAAREQRATLVGPPDGLGKAGGGHKYSHGHALVLSGGFGRTGAARLAARAALRVGAGLVTLGAPGAAQMEVAAQITALMLRRVEEAEDLAALLGDARLNALCLGPGLGQDRARDLVPVALEAGRAVLLDADALSAFAGDPDELFDMLHEGCVLTPHGGEFARLFPDLAEQLAARPESGPAFSRVDAAREAARQAGCTVLLKGPDTVIAAPDGRVSVHAAVGARSAPWLATAGAGDVLAGLIAGLMARGLSPFQAACSGAWLHVEAALAFGPGLIAEDLPEALPGVLRGLAG
ncbi:NAD(P)H-hydrate dehydratase [Salipiger abyssi]|uniref:Bifunctional NAD(P)H-hydrate repair enzyme n=1 Tax=Salipiger abyssi TaxID=1250539 RepID=A0A1P8UYJ1_9RHOB|nr:NAD(P)H-hydrate dehydratase [Salipiger abyssi]APZ54451.1 yjeF-like protein, hydroxyethylthiazole kinase-related [Salipiger abyssi]